MDRPFPRGSFILAAVDRVSHFLRTDKMRRGTCGKAGLRVAGLRRRVRGIGPLVMEEKGLWSQTGLAPTLLCHFLAA